MKPCKDPDPNWAKLRNLSIKYRERLAWKKLLAFFGQLFHYIGTW